MLTKWQHLYKVTLRKLARFWLRIYPKISSLIATIGFFGLASCLLIIYVLSELSEEVLEREAFAFDKTILLWIHSFANPTLDKIMLGITRLGDPITVGIIAGVTLTVLWLRRYRLEAKIFIVNCIGGVILSDGLKLAFGKSRPQLWDSLISEETYSYPSGHALGSMVLYGFIANLLADLYPQYFNLIYIVATILIAAIGLSRLYLGVHWPTDVIAGYGVGFLWITLTITMLNLLKLKLRSKNKR